MSNDTKPTPQNPDEKKPARPPTEQEDANLDEELKESFPASDPPSSGHATAH